MHVKSDLGCFQKAVVSGSSEKPSEGGARSDNAAGVAGDIVGDAGGADEGSETGDAVGVEGDSSIGSAMGDAVGVESNSSQGASIGEAISSVDSSSTGAAVGSSGCWDGLSGSEVDFGGVQRCVSKGGTKAW